MGEKIYTIELCYEKGPNCINFQLYVIKKKVSHQLLNAFEPHHYQYPLTKTKLMPILLSESWPRIGAVHVLIVANNQRYYILMLKSAPLVTNKSVNF